MGCGTHLKCSKSSVGTSLAEKLGVPFIDGDDLHPKANVEKMSRGEPLNDHVGHFRMVSFEVTSDVV